MSVFGFAALGLFTVASFAVGLRLLLLAARTHKRPELLLGAHFVLSVLGNALIFFARDAGVLEGAAQYAVVRVGANALNLGFAAQALFCWVVYRPRQRGALAAAVLLASLLGVLDTALELVPGSKTARLDLWLELALRGAAYGWGVVEALRFYGVMKKRVAYGIGAPLVMNRMLLWGLATSSAIGLLVSLTVARVLGPETHPGEVATVVGSAFALGASGLIWLAFFPSDGYRRWVRARQERES